MLQEISGHTANADWQRAFVSADALKILRKVTWVVQTSWTAVPAVHVKLSCPAASACHNHLPCITGRRLAAQILGTEHAPQALQCWSTPSSNNNVEQCSLLLLQSVKLQSLAIYFDCDVPLLDPGKRWDLITRERWDELLLPASHTRGCSIPDDQSGAVCSQPPTGGPDQQLHRHQFLLCPVDGMLHYLRRGKQARVLETDAEQEMHLQLKHISVRLHQLQYQSGQKLLQEFDRYAASAPHRNLRPHCRPAAGKLC